MEDQLTDLLLSEHTRKYEKHVEKLEVVHGSVAHILGEPFKIFTKYVKVFDLYFVATESSPDYKVLHGATVLYQYLDNNDSGIPDNIFAYAKLRESKGTMVMFKNQQELEEHDDFFDKASKLGIEIQDLEADETRPGSLLPHEFDEALEECFHLVTQGYVLAYPDIFGLKHGSAVSLMMDCARGGYFKTIPEKYPNTAWYTYRDPTCDYSCMIDEYLYWAMTTILGGQKYRHEVIKHEWRPYTPEQIKIIDNPIYTLLTDPIYRLPTKLPEPVAGIPLYASNRTSCKMAKNENLTCCGCFGKYPKKMRESLMNRFK